MKMKNNYFITLGVSRVIYKNVNNRNFHSSILVLSERKILNKELNKLLNSEEENKLQLVRLINKNEAIDNFKVDNSSSDYKELFPWLVDDRNGEVKFINLSENVSLFDAVSYVSKYLETRVKVNPDKISEVKISDYLKPFLENKEVTVKELFDHISKIQKENPGLFNSESVISKGVDESLKLGKLDIEARHPLGKVGDITFNDAINKLNDYNIAEFILNNNKIIIHGVPVAAAAVSYGFVIKTYMSQIHSLPIPAEFNTELLRRRYIHRKNIQLAIFTFVGAPLIVYGIRSIGIGLGDMITFEPQFNSGLTTSSTSHTNQSYFILFLKNITKYIPSWAKVLFSLIFISLLILKLFGFENFLLTFILGKTIYLKLLFLFLCSLAIIFNILNLYLIHLFSQSDIKISKLLPNFLIEWLEDFKLFSKNESGIKILRDMYYREIIIYLILIVLIIIFF